MRIGSLPFKNDVPLILAPLAGYTDFAFRLTCRRFGVDLTVSEMVSADGLVLGRPNSKGRRKTLTLADAHEDDHPFAVQLFGKDPAKLAEAVRVVCGERLVEMIDLNAGCPVRKVVSSGHGVALMRDPAALGKILEAMRQATDLPLTVKLRAGAEERNALECAKVAETAGVDAIAVHPRLRLEGFKGQADWSLIAAVKQAVDVPVIGNGDVVAGEDAVRMRNETGCDAVMIGRGAVGRPWLFAQARAALDGRPLPPEPDGPAKLEILRDHLSVLTDRKSETVAAKEMRKFALRLVRGVPGASSARFAIATAPTADALMAIVERVLSGEEI